MKLSDLRRQQGRQGSSQHGENEEWEPGTIRTAVPYQRPIGALHDGQPVTILATGDISGMSPAFQYVDENGHVDWASSDEFTVTDSQVVPQSSDQRNRLFKTASATGSSRR